MVSAQESSRCILKNAAAASPVSFAFTVSFIGDGFTISSTAFDWCHLTIISKRLSEGSCNDFRDSHPSWCPVPQYLGCFASSAVGAMTDYYITVVLALTSYFAWRTPEPGWLLAATTRSLIDDLEPRASLLRKGTFWEKPYLGNSVVLSEGVSERLEAMTARLNLNWRPLDFAHSDVMNPASLCFSSFPSCCGTGS